MHTLEAKESINYVGGAKLSIGLVTAISTFISFIFGVIDGFSNPKACNKR